MLLEIAELLCAVEFSRFKVTGNISSFFVVFCVYLDTIKTVVEGLVKISNFGGAKCEREKCDLGAIVSNVALQAY